MVDILLKDKFRCVTAGKPARGLLVKLVMSVYAMLMVFREV
jgi:hypothetical protein